MSTAWAQPDADAEAVTPASQDTRFIPSDLLAWDLGDGRTLRLATPDEFGEVGEVLQSAFTTGCWVTPTYKEHLAGIADRALTAHVWVAADADGVLGAVLTPKPQYLRDPSFTFNILGVGPRGRGLKLGERLVEHSVALARAFGYPVVEIRSSPHMTAAHGLYYRYGFVRRIDWETSVVDSGQRLLAFTYRVEDPNPDAAIPVEEPPTRWSFPNQPKETVVTLAQHTPPGTHDHVGGFRPEAPRLPGHLALDAGTRYRLVAAPDALRGRAARIARRLAAAQEFVTVEDSAAATPVLFEADGTLLSDDWSALARSILTATEAGRTYYPPEARAEIDTLEFLIAHDLVGGLERALFAGSEKSARVAQRVLYARLGEFDQTLAARPYLLGAAVTSADISLFSVLIGFDLEYRRHLGWGAASLVDYPNLWAYARNLLALPGFADDGELAALGLLASPDGSFEAPWGDPAPVEGVRDLRDAWTEPDDRDWSAA